MFQPLIPKSRFTNGGEAAGLRESVQVDQSKPRESASCDADAEGMPSLSGSLCPSDVMSSIGVFSCIYTSDR